MAQALTDFINISPMPTIRSEDLVDYQVTDSSNFTSTIPPPDVNNTNTTKHSGWLGLDSTQVLIVFLIVIFLVLIVFLLIYYYVIRGMRQKSQPKQGPKSVSASIEKERNIFADKQLAVDSSVKTKPKLMELEHNQQVPSANSTIPIQASSSPAVPDQPVKLANLETLATVKKSVTTHTAPVQNQPSTTTHLPTNPMSHSQTNNQDKSKSSEPVKPKKSSSDRKNRREAESNTVLGALAGLGETLRETVGTKKSL